MREPVEQVEAEMVRLNNSITKLEEWLIKAFNNNDIERATKEKAEAERDRLLGLLHEFLDMPVVILRDEEIEAHKLLRGRAREALEDKP